LGGRVAGDAIENQSAVALTIKSSQGL
jgi:hypothetical protein